MFDLKRKKKLNNEVREKRAGLLFETDLEMCLELLDTGYLCPSGKYLYVEFADTSRFKMHEYYLEIGIISVIAITHCY